MRYFLDTEFLERPGTLELVSLGLVSEDGRELYCESTGFDARNANDWVKRHVLPKLGPAEARLTHREIADRVRAFVGEKPEFWGYYADYDWVLFCWLFGPMVELPTGWPMYCRDLKQHLDEHDVPKEALPAQAPDKHHALADARWLRKAFEAVHGAAETLAIWWTTPEDAHYLADVPLEPEWLGRELRSRLGRPGRSRLWVAPQFGDIDVSRYFEAPMRSMLVCRLDAASAAGIVIRQRDVSRLRHLPGLVTDLEMERFEARP